MSEGHQFMSELTHVAPLVVQLDWVLDYEPAWLGPAVMIFGLVVFVGGFAINYSSRGPLMWISYVVIAVFALVPWVGSYPQLGVAVLFLLGAWFEGIGTVRAFAKLHHYISVVPTGMRGFLSGSSASSSAGSTASSQIGGFTRKAAWFLIFQLAILLCVALSVWVVLLLSIIGELTLVTLSQDIIVLWTLVTLTVAVFGFLWKIWSVKDIFPFSILGGLSLLISGAELYNLKLIQNEIALFLLGKVVYVLAFVAAASLWIVKLSAKSEPWSSSSEVLE